MDPGRRKAVVIDDETRISDLVRLLLTRLEFDVKCAADGEKGLALVMQEKPDLLVTDMLLPKLHGLEICKAVRSNPSLSATRIVAMTAIYKRLKFRLEARDVRVDAYVEKPFDVKEFAKVIQGLFPGNGDNDEIDAHMEMVKKSIEKEAISFGAELPDDLLEIEELWNRYRLDQEDPADLLAMRTKVHRLTGSAALYGFHEVSRICRQLEKTLSDIDENGGAIIKSQQKEVSDLLDLLAESTGKNGGDDSTSKIKGLSDAEENAEGEEEAGIPLAIVSMAPHKLEALVKGLASFGYKARLFRFGEIGRKDFSLESRNVVLDLRQIPSGTVWMEKLDVCGRETPLNVVAVGNGPGRVGGVLKSGNEEFCWKWVKESADVYDVVWALEKDEERSKAEEPYRLLIVMAEMAMSEHFQILFRQEGFLASSCEVDMIFGAIREFQPDVVLLDFQKPIQKTIAQVRTIRVWRQDIPVLVNGDSISPEELNELEVNGVTGVVSTSNPLSRLAFSVKSRARCWRLVRDSREKYYLPGVDRYSHFMEAMETELKWASRSAASMAVAVFGLDHVAELNRKVGERGVDRLLAALCRLIRGKMQGRDRIGQAGGGIFAAFFTGMAGQRISRLLSELQKRYSSLSFSCGETKVNATFSAGVARFPNLSDRNYLFEAALDALLRARKSGGNRIISTF
ncbi:MAG: hypothetical protein DRJ14_00800 [Acidobacteria bacterium]|nr:MAG: hypothetical protein DRJ14_00800 [Acidobacteriota bacterium]